MSSPNDQIHPGVVVFPPFELDLRAGQLRRGGSPVALRPKSFAVLRYLAERPGELVTKRSLLDAIWGGVAVSEDVLRISIGEVRAALGDDRASPKFIETVARRGYRFVVGPPAAVPVSPPPLRAARPAPAGAVGSGSATGLVVGRVRERAEIEGWLVEAAAGRRQVAFVAGEAGIGKTTLVDLVLGEPAGSVASGWRVARGQCVEQYGEGEPYMPVLEALGSLCRGPEGAAVERVLREHAPAWLPRVVGLEASLPDSGAGSGSNAHENTLQRLASSLDALAAECPLVAVLEDVQWSDTSTLELLSVIAQRRGTARLLVLCTLRPVDAIIRGHPVATLRREFLRKGLAREVALGGLSAVEVASFLSSRFEDGDLPEGVASLVVERSEGNPFYLVTLVDHLIEAGRLVESEAGWQLRGGIEALRAAIPDGVRALIEPRLEHLDVENLRLLQVASVVGPEFAAHAVAGVALMGNEVGDVEIVEQRCDVLVRRQGILRAVGETAWPDGTRSARYAFRHAYYQDVIYQGLSPSVRRRLHQEVGERLEAAHGAGRAQVASELAAHFERSRDLGRAARYHREAAAQSSARYAYEEARQHLEVALAMLGQQPEAAERWRGEVAVLEELGTTLFGMRGYGDEGGADAFARMLEIAERLDGALARLQAMEGQLIVHTMRAEYVPARALATEMLALGEELGNRPGIASALTLLASSQFNLAEVASAREYAARAASLFDPAAPPTPNEVGVNSCILVASACGYLGEIAAAREWTREALARADALGTPFHRAIATNLAAGVYMLLDDVPAAASLASEAERLTTEYGLASFRSSSTMIRAWCEIEAGRVAEGLDTFRAALAEHATTGQRYSTTGFGMLLARAHLAAGDAASAALALDSAMAFAEEAGERIFEPELLRLRGECVLAGNAGSRGKAGAVAHFERALALAADRKGLLFELRAATSLFRVLGSARERLVAVVDRFGAGNDCADRRVAFALLGR